MKPVRVLSIDGGGIRGILPAQVLVVLEQLLQKHSKNSEARIADYFDLIAGTSTGGILTCALLCPYKNNPTRPKFTAKQTLNIYVNNGSTIFKKSLFRSIRTVFGLISPKYSCKNINKILYDYLGDVALDEILKPCLITSYEIETHRTIFFNKLSAQKDNKRNFYLRDVARSTSAAPTFFQPNQCCSFAGSTYALIDGGVYANNPALCAYSEARKLEGNPCATNMLILSLGTGSYDKTYSFKKAKHWGIVKWLLPTINIIMNGSADTVDYQLRSIFDATGNPKNYLRVQSNLTAYDSNVSEMDNASAQNVKLLLKIGENTATDYYKELDEFAKMLVEVDMQN